MVICIVLWLVIKNIYTADIERDRQVRIYQTVITNNAWQIISYGLIQNWFYEYAVIFSYSLLSNFKVSLSPRIDMTVTDTDTTRHTELWQESQNNYNSKSSRMRRGRYTNMDVKATKYFFFAKINSLRNRCISLC